VISKTCGQCAQRPIWTLAASVCSRCAADSSAGEWMTMSLLSTLTTAYRGEPVVITTTLDDGNATGITVRARR